MDINNKFIFIIGIYRPPSGDLQSFILLLESLLGSLLLRNKIVIISGDMNLNLNDMNSPYVISYLSLLHSYMFIPVITKPTRFPSGEQYHTPSVI